MEESTHGQTAVPNFPDEAAEVLTELQSACSALLKALPVPVRRAVDLERCLKLDKKLAWQIFKVASSDHVLAEGLNVPSHVSMQRLVRNARKEKVPEDVIQGLLTGYQAFDEFVSRHAEDRETLSSLMASLASDLEHDVMQRHRKAMFNACSHVWGLRVDAAVRCEIYHPSKDKPGRLDVATITSWMNLQRLRNDLPFSVSVGATWPGDERKRLGADDLPVLLDGFFDGPADAADWLPDPHQPGHAVLELTKLGRAAAVSFHTLQVTRDVGLDDVCNSVMVCTPTRSLFCDLLVPSGLSDPTSARVTVSGSRDEFPVYDRSAKYALPHRHYVDTFTNRDNVPPTFEVSNYQRAVTRVLESLGWDTTRFDVFRSRVEYPLFHTMVSVTVDLADDAA